MSEKHGEAVAVISRLDYGRPGFRRWILDALKTIATGIDEAKFVIIQGGLVSSKHLLAKLPKGAGKKRAEAYEELVEQTAQNLARLLPEIRNKRGHLVKYYIFTSPATNYDGIIGKEVAARLAEIRRQEPYNLDDVRFWDETSGRLDLKGLEKLREFDRGDDLWVVLPHRGVAQLGGVANYSVRPERFIREKRKQSKQKPPAIWSSDCGGTSVARPVGESSEPWMSVPMAHVPDETITTENQVGIRVLEFRLLEDRDPPVPEFSFRTYSLKDIAANEREMIPVPEAATPVLKETFAQLKTYGPRTIGRLEDVLGIRRRTIAREIARYNRSGLQPKILFDGNSQRYDFDPEWIQWELRCPLPPLGELREDKVVAAACLHGGSAFTEYEFFLNRVPELILESGTNVLAIAGDLIQGLYHYLTLRGEVVPGFESYTYQEELSGRLCAQVMLKVFRERFRGAFANFSSRKPSDEELRSLISACLILFLFRRGNHDDWQTRDGHEPLRIFRDTIIDTVARGIGKLLYRHDIVLRGLRDLVAEHVVQCEKYRLPSGLCLEMFHPYKARTKASSQRAQECLETSDCQLIIEGNFHVAVAVEEWSATHGQRVVLQVGTIVWMTGFEKSLLKNLDVGVGYVRTLSHKGRIFMSEVRFVGDTVRNPDRGPEKARQVFHEELGI